MSCKIIQATITRPLRPTIVKVTRKALWVLARCICCSSLDAGAVDVTASIRGSRVPLASPRRSVEIRTSPG
jgi:hypothetical protein